MGKLMNRLRNTWRYRSNHSYVKDAVIVSHPRSGITWIRYLLHNLLLLSGKTEEPEESLTFIAHTHDKIGLPTTSPESLLSNRGSMYDESKVILLLRDPRDMLVSNWFHQRYMDSYSGSLSEFLRDDCFGVDSYVSWVKGWQVRKDMHPGFMVLEYERMRRFPTTFTWEILAFCELYREFTVDQVASAVKASTFDRMFIVERARGCMFQDLRPYQACRRRSKPGDYKIHFSEDDLKYVNDALKDLPDIASMYRAEFDYDSAV